MKKIVFLDRDGTLNVDRGYVYRQEDWEFTDQAPQAISHLQNAGFRIAVVTNQSGVAAGMYSAADVERLHDFMCRSLSVAGQARKPDVRLLHDFRCRELVDGGAGIDAVAYCPHSPHAACDCRKPRTGLARQIERHLVAPLDYAASWTIGDKLSDVEFGRALGTHTALIRSRYWTAADLNDQPDLIVDSLYDAAMRITSSHQG